MFFSGVRFGRSEVLDGKRGSGDPNEVAWAGDPGAWTIKGNGVPQSACFQWSKTPYDHN